MILKLDPICILSLLDQIQGERINQVDVLFSMKVKLVIVPIGYTAILGILSLVELLTVVSSFLFAGSGPYVVIDNRTKSSTDAHETSSDDGNVCVNCDNKYVGCCLIHWVSIDLFCCFSLCY